MRTYEIRGLLLLLTVGTVTPALVQAAPLQAQQTVAARVVDDNPLERMSQALTLLTQNALASSVAVEGQAEMPSVAVQLVLPPPPQNLGSLSPEKQQKYAQELAAAQEAARRRREARTVRVVGSGFVIPGGFVVTSADVAQGLKSPVVVLSSGKRLRVAWTELDAETGVAVMKVDGMPETLGLRWAESSPAAGNMALTIGLQAGFSHTASVGFLAGVGRRGLMGGRHHDNLLQFQGAVGGGSSGGPLINTRGEVIGMVLAAPGPPPLTGTQSAAPGQNSGRTTRFHRRPTSQKGDEATSEAAPAPPPAPTPMGFPFDGVSNTAFAMPSGEMRAAVEMLRHRLHNSVRSGWIGVDVDQDFEGEGARIREIYVGSPADRARLQGGDIIIAINGKPIHALSDLQTHLRRVKAGEAMLLRVRRGQQELDVQILIEARPNFQKIEQMPKRGSMPQTGLLWPPCPSQAETDRIVTW